MCRKNMFHLPNQPTTVKLRVPLGLTKPIHILFDRLGAHKHVNLTIFLKNVGTLAKLAEKMNRPEDNEKSRENQ
jgi:hypothetical protein